MTQILYGNRCGFWLGVDPANQLEPGSCFLDGGAAVVHIHHTLAEFGCFQVGGTIVKGRYGWDIETFQDWSWDWRWFAPVRAPP